MGLIDDAGIRDKTKRTSAALFRGVKNESGGENNECELTHATLNRHECLFYF